jgi:hypothetical protein
MPVLQVILNAISSYLAKADQPAAAAAVPRQQQQQQQQQQQLPSLPQVIASISAAVAASSSAAAAAGQAAVTSAGLVTEQDLQQLWQQLLQLLFPAVYGNSSLTSTGTAAAVCAYPFQSQAVLDLNDVMEDVITGANDVDDSSEDGGSSWDESEGWQEVHHSSDAAAGAAEEDAEAAGELLAAAIDPLYQQSAKRCLAAARSALAAYLKVSGVGTTACK